MCPSLAPAHFQRGAPRRGLQAGPDLQCSPSAGEQTRKLRLHRETHRPGWGRERVRAASKVTQRQAGCDLGELLPLRQAIRPYRLEPGPAGMHGRGLGRGLQRPGAWSDPSIPSPTPMGSRCPHPQGHGPTLKALTTTAATSEPHSEVHVPNVYDQFQTPPCPPTARQTPIQGPTSKT